MDATSTTEPFRFNAPHAGSPSLSTGEDSLVRETRREIASIVRETAEWARRDIPTQQFFNALTDRVARAMAAEGVVIWHCHRQDLTAIARVGKQTDRSLSEAQRGCHLCMLSEVAQSDQPVVVPATPDACDDTLPSNPTDTPVAVVPILASDGEPAEYLLEVFLERDGGPATQRGYLRFAAQMADLAGDYLRLHRIRSGQRAQTRWNALSAILPSLHRSLDRQTTATQVVDAAAEVFDVDRVSLCRVQASKTRLVAVSHIDAFDPQTPEAAEIRRSAAEHASADAVPAGWFSASEILPPTADPPDDDDALHCEVVLPLPDTSGHCFVFQHRTPRFWDDQQRSDLQYFAKHAAAALNNSESHARIPWARAAALLPAWGDASTYRWRTIGWLLLACVLTAVAAIPVPMIVTARAELSAIGSQFLYAPSDGVVAEIFVRHGQPVSPGQELLTITDRVLEEKEEVLIGQRAVLVERSAELSSSLAGSSQRRREDQARLQSEQRVIDQQLASLDRQLAILMEQRERLTLRSDRAGVVDGWQIERSLRGRPVAAGQTLLSIIEPRLGWHVEAFVPQSRLDHVLRAARADSSPDDTDATLHLSANIVLRSHPEQSFAGKLVDIGPSLTVQADEGPVARTLFALPSAGLPPIQTGTPATVAIDCGKRPLAMVAFQDFIRTVRGAVSMYF